VEILFKPLPSFVWHTSSVCRIKTETALTVGQTPLLPPQHPAIWQCS